MDRRSPAPPGRWRVRRGSCRAPTRRAAPGWRATRAEYPPPAAPRVVLPEQSVTEPSQSFQTDCDGDRAVGQGRAARADDVGLRPGIVDGELVRAVRRKAVLGAGVTRGGDHGLPLQSHALEDPVLRLPIGGGHARLAHAPARRHDLCAVVAGNAVEDVERLRVVTVGRLVDDERGGGGVEGGELRIERGLAPALTRTARAPVDLHVTDGVGQPVTGFEGGEVARGVLLELHDGDGLPDAGAALREELVEAEEGGQLRRGVRAPGGRALGAGAGLGGAGVGHGCGRRRRGGLRLRRLRRLGGARRRRRRSAAGPRLSMSCSRKRPSRPTTPVTTPFKDGGHLRRRRVDDDPRRLTRRPHRLQRRAQRGRDHGGRATDRQQRAARLGSTDGQPLGCAGRRTPGPPRPESARTALHTAPQ